MHSRLIIAVKNGRISSFLIVEQYSIVYIYHIFFIHSPIDGHLSFFSHSSVSVNYVAMNKGVQIYHQNLFLSFLSGIYLEVEMLDHKIDLFFKF